MREVNCAEARKLRLLSNTAIRSRAPQPDKTQFELCSTMSLRCVTPRMRDGLAKTFCSAAGSVAHRLAFSRRPDHATASKQCQVPMTHDRTAPRAGLRSTTRQTGTAFPLPDGKCRG